MKPKRPAYSGLLIRRSLVRVQPGALRSGWNRQFRITREVRRTSIWSRDGPERRAPGGSSCSRWVTTSWRLRSPRVRYQDSSTSSRSGSEWRSRRFDTGLVAWHIEKGEIDGLDVSGVTAVSVSHHGGNRKGVRMRLALFVDEGASEQQTKALARALSDPAVGAGDQRD